MHYTKLAEVHKILPAFHRSAAIFGKILIAQFGEVQIIFIYDNNFISVFLFFSYFLFSLESSKKFQKKISVFYAEPQKNFSEMLKLERMKNVMKFLNLLGDIAQSVLLLKKRQPFNK